MKTKASILVVLTLISVLTGCIPERRVAWSPDGSKAAVATPNGLFMIDSEGKVLAPKWEGSGVRCDWFRNGRKLAVAYSTKARSWNDIATTFTSAQVNDIKLNADKIRERLLAHEGSWQDFQLDPENLMPKSRQIGALLYLRDNLAEGLKDKLGDKWEDLQKLEVDLWHLRVLNLNGDKFDAEPELVRSVNEIVQPRVSPDGKNIAFLKTLEDKPGDQLALYVTPADSSAIRTITDDVAIEYDWSPDSTGLAFVHCTAPRSQGAGNVYLGSLATIRIANADGTLLKQWEKQEEKVSLLYNVLLTVRWLTDGRLVFSALEVTFPATIHDMPQRWNLFVLDPRTPAGICRALRRDLDLPLEPSFPLFNFSPDEKQVLLSATNGRVVLYNLASGESKLLDEVGDPKGGIRSLPSWRSPTEITFVRMVAGAPGENPRAEAVLLKDGKAKILSSDWPEQMKEGWLVGK